MSASESRWRTRSREVIAAVLLSVPHDAPPKQVRSILRGVYPFGQRENQPYRIWCEEVRKAMKARGVVGAQGKVTVVYCVRFMGELPWLEVNCGWCDGTIKGGCLQCVKHEKEVRRVVLMDEFRALRSAVRNGDEVARAALGDWLTEQIGSRCGL